MDKINNYRTEKMLTVAKEEVKNNKSEAGEKVKMVIWS